ncbi:MAG: transposase [Desulfatiglans sp.]|nr:transposase [Desulfatiglans sp.]
MSRPLRIEYTGAWYHVMNRGGRYISIFEDKNDYSLFLDILKDTIETFHIKIAAFCLMQNHYHLLIQTPESNISRSMRHINGVYTQRFNKLHGYDGALFRGRYKSILVDEDSYLLQVMRYIHRNPVTAGLTDKFKYPWSSHKAYLSNAKEWGWVSKDKILSMLNRNKSLQKAVYKDFVNTPDNDDFTAIYKKRKLPVILGNEKFLSNIKDRYFKNKRNIEIPESKILVPDKSEIMSVLCREYKVSLEDLKVSRRGQKNEARDIAIYLIRQIRSDTLNTLSGEFNLKKDSSAGSIVDRVKKQIQTDKQFRCKINSILKKLNMSY